ncbi:peptidylprolyl isomerase [uncultured Brevundimonas sp.]|uniref:peptidylprolyl isomerase n=1 Tax=uncultured Brevundimonas sp. TaxID=213418 RepID=UPI0030ECDC5D|tara:strand:- start:38781 stop:39404 length:624 start_codon:yes stop_codon:yes gene_type:complete
MIRRTLVGLALLLLWPTLAVAQDASVPPPPLPRVVMETSAGRIVIEVNDRQAPITGANFLRYVDEHRFDGTSFYRAMRSAPDLGLVQGGTNNDPARVLPPIAHEPTTVTGLSHVDGAVSMARYDAGTATGDFFVSVGPTPSYDAGRPFSIDDYGFAVFGRVVEGMDVVRGILIAPTSPTEGDGFMRGQMLDPRIEIVTARRETVPAI